MTKIFEKLEKKLQKLVSFCVFVFVVPKHIAHKMVTKVNLSRKRPSSTFKNFNLRLIKQKNSKNHKKNIKNCSILKPKTPKNDLLTFN